MLTRLRKIRPAGFIAGFLAALVVGGGGVAYAANGGYMVIGTNNYGTRGTGINDAYGTPLWLNGKAGYAPLRVNSVTKVPLLNVDQLDNLDSTAFALTGGQTGYIAVEGQFIDVDGDGTDDTLAASAVCPTGTKVVGGGVDNFTGNPTAINSPGGSQAWDGAALADPNTNTVGDLVTYVVCYNPRGAVAGSKSTASAAVAGVTTKVAQSPMDALRNKLASHTKK